MIIHVYFFNVWFRGDTLGKWATAFVILLASPAHAEFDFSVGSTFRSYPLSGVAEVETGYGQLLWGTPRGPFSGYTRIRLDGATAGSYNSMGGAVELFPLAILGVRAGGEAVQNDSEYSAYDCERYGCLGRFYRKYIEAESTLGVGPVFLRARWRREHWTQKDAAAGDFIEPTSGLSIRSSGDSETIYHAVLGLKINPRWSTLAVYRYAQTDDGVSRFPAVLVRLSGQQWTVGVGAGVFESTLKASSVSALAFLRWNPKPSLALN